MKTTTTRLLALLLAVVMVISMVPATFAAKAEEPTLQLASTQEVLTQDDYADIDALFAELDAMEDRPATKGVTQTSQADAAYDMILASENYVEGSINRNGNTITWSTTEGIRCIYDPYMREKRKNIDSSAADNNAYNEPKATKGGSPSSDDVYLIAPYYGQDSSFTDQYKNEATSIASAIGDSDGYTLYSGSSATVDKVATAISNGAVVIFDSHGTTDYSNGEDYVTGANYSYLCLTTNSGITTADYNDGCMYGSGYAYINGETISNHMTSDSPGGLLWMAICLGMATDGLCAPMRNRGVEVVYGYSQSVTFTGDYKYEATFWDEMCAGSTVADAIDTMKTKHGKWDPAYSSYSLSTARSNYVAFPVVVSDEDAHPGQRSSSSYGACSYQTVKSTYTLFGDGSSSGSGSGSGSSSGSGSTDTDTSSYYTMTFSVNGSTSAIAPMTAESFTLPTPASYSGYTFAGWATSALTTASTTKPTLYSAGGTYTISSDITLYAIYSYTSASKTYYTSKISSSGSGSGSTDTDTSSYYTMTFSVNGSTSAIAPMTAESFTLPTPASYSGYTFAGWATSALTTATTTKPTLYSAGGTYTISSDITLYAIYSYTSSSKTYYTSKISSSGSGSGSSSSSYYTMTFSVNGSTSAIAPMTAESFTLPTPASYSGYTFAGWATSALTTATTTKPTLYSAGGTYTISANITLYAIYSYTSSSKTYYTSKPTVSTACQHSSTTNVAATAATCTTAGYTAGVYCNSCGTYVSGHSSVAATGHDYETTTVAPTSSSQGYDYHECANCGDSYMDNYVEANSSEGYTVTFVVPAGVTAIAPKQCTELTLPTPSGTPKYSTSDVQFVGWTTQVVDNSTTEPTIYDCTSTYTISSDVTLYAVYTYGGNGEMTFTMYDGSSSLYIGDSVIIVASSFNYAMSKKLNANSRKAAAITKNSDNTITISPDSDVAIFTLGWGVNGSSSSNQISFKDESGYLTTSSNTNNYMPTSSTLTAEGSFTFSLNDAKNVKLTAQGQYSRKIMRYNSSSKLFSCYSSSTKNAIKLYVLTSEGGSNLTYTTEFAAKRVHTDVTTITVPATCTENGSATTICNDCGTVLGVEVLPAAGHSYVNGYCACGDMAPVDADGAVHASDLTIYNKSLSLQSYVAFNFLVEKSVLENYDSCYVVFERSDAKSGVISETCYGQAFGNDFMQFEYKVYSYQMSDTLTATLYALKDGVVYVGETYSSSVRDYAMSKLAESTDDAYKTMVANLLTYGAKAQVYSDYRTEDMADSALGQYAAFVTTSLPTVANKASSTNKGLTGVTLFENALGIASSVQIQFITKLSAGYSTDKLYAEVCWDRDGTAMSKKIDGADFATVGNGSYYTVVFQDLTAKEGRTPVTVTIYDKTTGEAVSESWTYSIESYVANRQNSSAKVLAVLNSMMNYYDSAAAYFKN